MRESSLEQLFERLKQCEELAKLASDKSVREKAAELARDYRVLIARTGQLAFSSSLRVIETGDPMSRAGR